MTPAVEGCLAPASVSVTAPLTHLCPFRDEIDEGTVTISWDVAGGTLELHSLRRYLDRFRASKLSHEEATARIFHDLSSEVGVRLLSVSSTWSTAGMEVAVEVLRDTLKLNGA
jgi:NADPH-dependent 7-cyano-7-deazaguanine reductase QueF